MTKGRRFLDKWLQKYSWLVFSPSEKGTFHKFCKYHDERHYHVAAVQKSMMFSEIQEGKKRSILPEIEFGK